MLKHPHLASKKTPAGLFGPNPQHSGRLWKWIFAKKRKRENLFSKSSKINHNYSPSRPGVNHGFPHKVIQREVLNISCHNVGLQFVNAPKKWNVEELFILSNSSTHTKTKTQRKNPTTYFSHTTIIPTIIRSWRRWNQHDFSWFPLNRLIN